MAASRQVSPFSEFPFAHRSVPSASELDRKRGRDNIGNHWSVSSLSSLLDLRALQPLTLLVYPPLAVLGERSQPLEGFNAAVGRIRDWIRQQPEITIQACSSLLLQQREKQQQPGFAPVSLEMQTRFMLTDGIDCIRHLSDRQVSWRCWCCC